jgi:hypothetical protein
LPVPCDDRLRRVGAELWRVHREDTRVGDELRPGRNRVSEADIDLKPGQTVRVEVIDRRPKWYVSKYPTVKDKLP